MSHVYLPRTVGEVMRWARGQIEDPDMDYSVLCQRFCRTAYGVPAWSVSARKAFDATPRQHKHTKGEPEDAPRGALLYYDIGTFGHVALAAGVHTDTRCISNDYIRRGKIDFAPRDLPRWGVRYLGWSAWTPFGELRV